MAVWKQGMTAGGAVLYEGPGNFCWSARDSMAAIKKLVFDEQKYSLTQIAMDANWQGDEFAEIHRDSGGVALEEILEVSMP